jgi:hypothetical protein
MRRFILAAFSALALSGPVAAMADAESFPREQAAQAHFPPDTAVTRGQGKQERAEIWEKSKSRRGG